MKNKIMRVALVMMALTLITSCFVGSTFARYVTSANAESSATVAKWVLKQDDKVITDEVTFNLFNKEAIYQLDSNNTVDSGAPATIAQPVDGYPIIAPGTGGYYTFNFTNESSVDAMLVLEFNGVLNDVPLEFSYNNGETNDDWVTLNNLHDTEVIIPAGGSKTITLNWRWRAYGDHSDLATTDKNVTVSIDVLFEQVIPEEY